MNINLVAHFLPSIGRGKWSFHLHGLPLVSSSTSTVAARAFRPFGPFFFCWLFQGQLINHRNFGNVTYHDGDVTVHTGNTIKNWRSETKCDGTWEGNQKAGTCE
uniref:Uncharacterized protein n=1 Tax=Cacopsylla melanoneura TaxID=428564 RepID=A0A8D9E432_9HEMI